MTKGTTLWCKYSTIICIPDKITLKGIVAPRVDFKDWIEYKIKSFYSHHHMSSFSSFFDMQLSVSSLQKQLIKLYDTADANMIWSFLQITLNNTALQINVSPK